ncbi:hypothetical protein VNO80_14747 [Phaseolus coccineus]|uniref:Phytosulfokine n=1 Tax=Phaseolus coccineus TaxID=3886 RepID=A0AAN9R1P0_PHACN
MLRKTVILYTEMMRCSYHMKNEEATTNVSKVDVFVGFELKTKTQHIALLFFLLILSSFLASARLLHPPKAPRQGEREVEVSDNAISQSSLQLNDNMEELMGSEECYVKDEACSSRRMMVDAHLDYIYTQYHKP